LLGEVVILAAIWKSCFVKAALMLNVSMYLQYSEWIILYPLQND